MIEFINVNKAFGSQVILNQFNLKVETQEMCAIVGASGKGKSTILNMIGQLEKIDSGTYLYEGKDYSKMNRNRRIKSFRTEIAYLFQNYALMNNKSVEANLKIALTYVKGINKEEKMKEALRKVGLEDKLKHKVFTLSGGEQQRVALAKLLLKPSKLILADEPTGNLDEENAEKVFEILKALQEEGKSIIVVTHDRRFLHYFDHVVEL